MKLGEGFGRALPKLNWWSLTGFEMFQTKMLPSTPPAIRISAFAVNLKVLITSGKKSTLTMLASSKFQTRTDLSRLELIR